MNDPAASFWVNGDEYKKLAAKLGLALYGDEPNPDLAVIADKLTEVSKALGRPIFGGPLSPSVLQGAICAFVHAVRAESDCGCYCLQHDDHLRALRELAKATPT